MQRQLDIHVYRPAESPTETAMYACTLIGIYIRNDIHTYTHT